MPGYYRTNYLSLEVKEYVRKYCEDRLEIV